MYILIFIKMLKKIESSYFSKIIFSFVKEKNKLKALKYNKYVQKQMNISLFNYKFYSGRYIIYESKGKGKEYDGFNDELKFKGEYLNGERNGKGKEYKYGKLKFKGEYLNGKRNGKGNEYLYGILIFKGEYLIGKRNGKGKEHHWNSMEFEGEYLNGKRKGERKRV